MIILKHGCNSVKEIDSGYGAKVDLRDHNGKMVLSREDSHENWIFFTAVK